MRNIFAQFTEWGTRWLNKVDIEPFLRARLIVIFGYFAFASIVSFSVATVIDVVAKDVFYHTFAHPEFFSEAEAVAVMEDVRWSFRIFNLFIYAIGVYFLLGITYQPIRKATEFQKRFIANISHELRTPLAIAKTETELALRDTEHLTKEKAVALLEQNLKDITRVSRIIQFMTTLSDLNQRTVKESKEILLLSHVAKRVYETFTQRTDVSVELSLSIGDEGKIRGNSIALEKLLSNLLRNAIAHTPEDGKVVIGIRREKNNVVLSVKDTGEGIPSEDVPRIFEPFYRAHTGIREGSGLGLSIVREIAKLHDAKLKVASAVGEGTEISVLFASRAN